VFFVDDDQSGVDQWREDGGAGTDDELRIAGSRLLPSVEPLARAEAGVHDGEACAEAFLQSPYELWRQPDLRYQQQALPPGFELVGCSEGLRGRPSAVGTFGFVVLISDSAVPAQQLEAPMSITVLPQLMLDRVIPLPELGEGVPPGQLPDENLEALVGLQRIVFVGFPLNVQGGNGSPVRAAALVY